MCQKTDGTTINNAGDLNLVKLMYNIIEHSSNYSETTESLWFYSKDEATNFNNNVENIDNFKSFNYKAELLGKTVAQPTPSNANGILKKCSNFLQ